MAGSLAACRLAILPGPCDWSRPACSRGPTSTGWSRWSSSSSPSAGGGPSTASATPGATRSSTSGARSRRATGPTASRRSSPGSAACATDHGEGTGGVGVHRSSDPGHWIVTFPWRGEERARTIAEAALGARRARRLAVADRAADRRPGAAARPLDARGSPTRAPRRRPGSATRTGAIPVDLDLRDQRQEHGHPADHPHPASAPAGTSARPPRTASSSTSGWSSRATGPGPAARTRSSPAATSTSPSSRRPAAGIVLRGMGYESNEASVLTNVSSDHLDLQGIHTLPELAEVKSTVCRITKPDGWVVLNADDPLVAAVARRVRARVAFFSMADASPVVRRHRAARRPGVPRPARRARSRPTAIARPRSSRSTRVPITIGGLARHNVANALAAAGGARGLGATIEQVRDGLLDFRPSADRSPGRLNLFRLGARVVIVDFAHNEAGVGGDPRRGRGDRRRAPRAGPRRSPRSSGPPATGRTTRSAGSAGSRRSGRSASPSSRRSATCAGGRRSRSSASCWPGVVEGGGDPATSPVYETEPEALRAELNGAAGTAPDGGRVDGPRVIVLMCHEERDGVFRLLDDLGARPVDVASELTELVPRLQSRPRPDATPRRASSACTSACRESRAAHHRADVGRVDRSAQVGGIDPWRWRPVCC